MFNYGGSRDVRDDYANSNSSSNGSSNGGSSNNNKIFTPQKEGSFEDVLTSARR